MEGEGDKMLSKSEQKVAVLPIDELQTPRVLETSLSCSALMDKMSEQELLGRKRRRRPAQNSRCNSQDDLMSPQESSSAQSGTSKILRMTQIAPVHSRIYLTGKKARWKISLSPFLQSQEERLSEVGSNRRIRSYYQKQDELIQAYQNLEHELECARIQELEGSGDNGGWDVTSILAKLSLLANLVLLVAKAVAVALSNSISIISSLVDSCVDLFSGIIIWFTSRSIRSHNRLFYPSGKNRLEPVAIVVLSVVMSLASFQLVVSSITRVANMVKGDEDIPKFDIPTLIISCCTVAIKLVLFLLCWFHLRRGGGSSSSLAALMQDHRNDCFSNTIAAICGYLGSAEFIQKSGERNVIYIDPIGAILISCYIFMTWWKTGWTQVEKLTGHTASPQFLSKLTWLCLNHHPEVLMLDTVRAFHFGSNYLVEVDIVLPGDMPLREAHNIGEALQQKLERMPEVERAFVHLDFETSHRPEEEHIVKDSM